MARRFVSEYRAAKQRGFPKIWEKYDPVADTSYPGSIWSDIIGLEKKVVGRQREREKEEWKREREGEVGTAWSKKDFMKIARWPMRRGVSAVADRSFGRSTPFVLVGVETPPPRSRHDTPPRTASRSAWDARSSPWLPWSRAFASRFSSLPRASDLRLVLFRFGRLAPFPSPLHSLVTLGQEPDTTWTSDTAVATTRHDSSPVIRGPRSRSPFDSDRASAFAPAPALDHAATAFAFAFAFATPTKPPPPRYANDRRAKGDCPSECRSRAQSSLAPRSGTLSLRASFPHSFRHWLALPRSSRRMCAIPRRFAFLLRLLPPAVSRFPPRRRHARYSTVDHVVATIGARQ